MIRKTYENPESEQIFVKFEEGILIVSGDRNVTSTDGGVSGDDQYNDGYGDL